MLIGCPKEIKPQEFRVGLTPAAVREAVAHGHDVIIETGAGLGAALKTRPILLQVPRSWPPRRRSSRAPTWW